jgi:hypothetical protein
MNIVLFESEQRNCLLPLCYTRPVALLRTGILTIQEKWAYRLKGNFSCKTELYLEDKFPLTLEEDNLLVSSHICPNDELVKLVANLQKFQGIKFQGIPVAVRLPAHEAQSYPDMEQEIIWQDYNGALDYIRYPWDLNEVNARQLQLDFDLITRGRKSVALSSTNQIVAGRRCPGGVCCDQCQCWSCLYRERRSDYGRFVNSGTFCNGGPFRG